MIARGRSRVRSATLPAPGVPPPFSHRPRALQPAPFSFSRCAPRFAPVLLGSPHPPTPGFPLLPPHRHQCQHSTISITNHDQQSPVTSHSPVRSRVGSLLHAHRPRRCARGHRGGPHPASARCPWTDAPPRYSIFNPIPFNSFVHSFAPKSRSFALARGRRSPSLPSRLAARGEGARGQRALDLRSAAPFVSLRCCPPRHHPPSASRRRAVHNAEAGGA